MINQSIIMGRLTANPELRTTQNGKPYSMFTVAVQRSRKDTDGSRQTDFIDCSAWGKNAEFLCNWFEKGAMIIIRGELRTRDVDAGTESRQKRTTIHADEITFGESKKARTGHSGANAGDLIDMPDFEPVPFE